MPTCDGWLLGVGSMVSRWVDVPGEGEVVGDPGMERAAYAAWMRGEDELDVLVDDDDLLEMGWVTDAPVWGEAGWMAEWEEAPAVYVNGKPLAAWLILDEHSLAAEFGWDWGRHVLEADGLVAQYPPAPDASLVHRSATLSREVRLARIRRSKVDDELGWGTSKRGRRWNTGSRYGHSTHSNLSAAEADRVRQRRLLRRPPAPLSEWARWLMALDDGIKPGFREEVADRRKRDPRLMEWLELDDVKRTWFAAEHGCGHFHFSDGDCMGGLVY